MSTNDPAAPVAIGEPGRGHRAWAAKSAVVRTIEIQDLAALIREVDGDHTMGASALAEALVDRGVTCRAGRYSAVR